MKKLFILFFMLFSLNAKATSTWHTISTEDLDFDFFKGKVKELLNDIVTTAVMFDANINKNIDSNKFKQMPTLKLKIGLNALVNDDIKTFIEKFEQFKNDIDSSDKKYKDYNLLMFGSLDELRRFVSGTNYLDSVVSCRLLTTAKPMGEIPLPRKNRKSIEWSDELKETQKVSDKVKTLTQEAIKETLETGVGKVLK